MRLVDAVIVAITDGEISELEFWRNNPVGYKTYDATPQRVRRVYGALANTEVIHEETRYYRRDATIHYEV